MAPAFHHAVCCVVADRLCPSSGPGAVAEAVEVKVEVEMEMEMEVEVEIGCPSL